MKAALYIENQMLRQYIKFLFPPDEETGELRVSQTDPLGVQLVTMVSTSDMPVPSQEGSVILRLPVHGGLTDRLQNHFLYYNRQATAILNNTLKSTFEIDFRLFYARGLQTKLMKKDIIDAFIFSRGLQGEAHDMLHKRVFRQELDTIRQLRRYFRNKAYYIENMISKPLKK